MWHLGTSRTAAPPLAWLALAAVLLLPARATLAAAEASTPEASPQKLVATLSTRLFAALDRDRAAYRRDPDLVIPLIDQLLQPHFDAEYLARLVLGSRWRTAAEEDRARFALALYHTLLRTYAGAVSEWSSDRFKLLPFTGDAVALQAIVRTQVTGAAGTVAAVDYRLHRTAEGWRVFDVIVDGVSYARSYHEDIEGELSQTGLASVIERLEKSNRRATAQDASHSR
jgi:phospholipid transport system substrate-binding protein